MTPAAGRGWAWRLADFFVALILVTVGIWVIVAGGVMVTCGPQADWFGWALLSIDTDGDGGHERGAGRAVTGRRSRPAVGLILQLAPRAA